MENTPARLTVTETRITMIFNEWAKRYSENPDGFDPLLGEDGKPNESYGEDCMRFFVQIANEMDAKGLLPVPETFTDVEYANTATNED